ncbi:hypothetical protein JHK85_051041 [Glycine max]|nr:hypothetical protein JHK85_051041 [Glycine max]
MSEGEKRRSEVCLGTMAEQKNRWSWDVAGFDPWKSSTPPQSPAAAEHGDRKPSAPLVRRYSISATSVLPQSKHAVAFKLQRLKDQVKFGKCFAGFSFCFIAGARNDDVLALVSGLEFALWTCGLYE